MIHIWQSTLFAAVAGLLTVALRKNHPRVRYWIWFAASAKFLIPFSFLISLGSHISWRTPDYASEPVARSIVAEPLQRSVNLSSSAASASDGILNGSFLQSLPPIAFDIWAFGLLAVLARWGFRWNRVRAVAQQAVPVTNGYELEILRQLERIAGRKKPVTLICSETVIEPCVFGILHPVLLWPSPLSEKLDREQLEAILLHELSHVRHQDNLIAAIHMLVEATCWFHPLVWWIGQRLIKERENACDQDALHWGAQSQAYAEGIVKVCEFCLESPLICAAGITGSDLNRRIEEIMKNRVANKLSVRHRRLLVAVAVIVLSGPILLGIAHPAPEARRQSRTIDARPTFEVAAVKINTSGAIGPGSRILGCHGTDSAAGNPGLAEVAIGRCVVKNHPLSYIIALAYGLPIARPALDQLFPEAPGWVQSERFDIDAKAEHPVSEESLKQMLQTLLADRFKLQLRTQEKEVQGYALLVTQSGPKLLRATGQKHDAPFGKQAPSTDAEAFTSNTTQGTTLNAYGQTLPMIAKLLSNILGKPVVNKAEVPGTFDFTLVWTPDESQFGGHVALPSVPGPSIFTALEEQLGLRLQTERIKEGTLIIDHVEKPKAE